MPDNAQPQANQAPAVTPTTTPAEDLVAAARSLKAAPAPKPADGAGPVPAGTPGDGGKGPAELKQEPKADEPKVPSPKDDPKLAAQFAQLAKREKRNRELVEQAKAERAEAEKLRRDVERINEARKLAKSNPLEALKMLDLSYDELSQAVINDGKATPDLKVRELKGEIDALKKQRQDEAESQKKALEAERDRTLSEWRAGTVDFVKKAGAEYELVNALDAQEYVTEVIEKAYAMSAAEGEPRIMQPAEAAAKVEKFFTERTLASPKLAKLFAEKQKAPAPPTTEPQRPTESAPSQRTVSNDLAASAPISYSEDDRMKRAMAALERSQTK